MAEENEPNSRPQRGRPDHHDPTSGIFGAPPAYSALTLRLVLAAVGLVVSGVLAVIVVVSDGPLWLAAVCVLLAVVAAVDLVVVGRRKRRGEPG
jgi:cytochrome c biogenesis factor